MEVEFAAGRCCAAILSLSQPTHTLLCMRMGSSFAFFAPCTKQHQLHCCANREQRETPDEEDCLPPRTPTRPRHALNIVLADAHGPISSSPNSPSFEHPSIHLITEAEAGAA